MPVLLALPALLGRVAAEPPVTLGREQAADLARRELTDPAYHQSDQPILLRLLQWLLDKINAGISQVGDHSPGGWLGVLALVVLVVAGFAVVRWRMGPVRRTAGSDRSVFDATERGSTAAEHRRRADVAAAREDWSDAVRERLRAVVRDLEERGLLDVRPGRTADEAAAAGGAVLPVVAAALRDGARAFDEVSYGGRAGDVAAYHALVALDRDVAAARPSGPARAGRAGDRFTEVPR
jgi:hypothetical protein